jgi:hypothetical protein
MTKVEYSIARQFTRHPGPRYRTQGPNSGESLRAKLVRILNKNPYDIIEIDLDGTSGFGSSFLDEAFGGLIRSEGFDRTVEQRFRFKSIIDPSYIAEIEESFNSAVPD